METKRQTNLCLEDVLDDSPQTRCLLDLFENDSNQVGSYMASLHSALERLVDAQSDITSAVTELGSLLGTYKVQNFPLEKTGNDFSPVVDKFHHTIIELSSWLEIVSQQLKNCALYPVSKFLREVNELSGRKDVFHAISDDMDSTILKHAKLSRKDKKIEEVNEELNNVRRRFHLDGLHYYASLNKLQYSRRIALLEPILSVIYAFRSFCHVGHQALTNDKELFDFFTRTQEQVQSLHNEHESESNKYKELIKTVNEIERLNPQIYNIEALNLTGSQATTPDQEKRDSVPVNSANTHKQGYLFMKSKSGLMSKWDRLFFFIQSGNLMAQTREELVGKVVMELSPVVKANIHDHDDRRHTFSVTCYSSKMQLILQAPSLRERDDWIAAINLAASETALLAAAVADDERRRSSAAQHDGNQSSNGAPPEVDSSSTAESPPAPPVPIQFDLLTPSDEQDTDCTVPLDADTLKNAFACPVKFLGSIEVPADRDDKVVNMATKQILDVRTAYQITKSVDVVATLVTTDGIDDANNQQQTTPPRLLLIDERSGEGGAVVADSIKASFRLDDVALWSIVSNHDDRLLALVVRTKRGRADGRHKFSCYLLNAGTKEAAKQFCDELTRSTRIVFQALAASGCTVTNKIESSAPDSQPESMKENSTVEEEIKPQQETPNQA